MISLPLCGLLVLFLTVSVSSARPPLQIPIRETWHPHAGATERRPSNLPCVQIHCSALQGPPGAREFRSTMDIQVYIDGHYAFLLHGEKNAHQATRWNWHGLLDNSGATWDFQMNGFCGNAEYRRINVPPGSNLDQLRRTERLYSLTTVRSHQEVDWDCLDRGNDVLKCSLWETVHENKKDSSCAARATPRLCFYRPECDSHQRGSEKFVSDTTGP
ncbi:hypothetical protein BU16DRAFT_558875 [Lophium mytilinum]|uniref:Cyanovirin-N domain-containing protein n=1 Tax=Lophium mytilinum TaxID=390894 RepID=A0A6A6R4X9_9PEZI|nr:hypothetical protein BU16DRAFT_558875 [Lophium mytilinum]